MREFFLQSSILHFRVHLHKATQSCQLSPKTTKQHMNVCFVIMDTETLLVVLNLFEVPGICNDKNAQEQSNCNSN